MLLPPFHMILGGTDGSVGLCQQQPTTWNFNPGLQSSSGPKKKNWALLPKLKINQRAFATFDRGFCSILGCKYWPTLINEVTRGIKWVKTDIN